MGSEVESVSMTAETDGSAETVLAELDPSRTVTLQWAVVSGLGFLVAMGAFGWLYGALTGGPAEYTVRASGVSWWSAAFDLLALVALTMNVGRTGGITHVFEFVNTPDAFPYAVGPGGLLVGGALGLAYAFGRAFRRQHCGPIPTEDPGPRDDRA